MNYSIINNYKNDDFVKIDNNNIVPFKNEVKTNNWATEGSISKSILGNISQPTPLSELFLSMENINRLQNKIKKEVFVRTNGKYVIRVNQNETDLINVMLSVYVADAINAPYNLVKQVKMLNHLTIQRIVPDMISMIKMEQEYLRVISSPINPIPLPVNVNNAGRRGTLPSITTTFNLPKI